MPDVKRKKGITDKTDAKMFRATSMTILRCCLLILVSASVVQAQDRVLGLLTLPEVFGAGPCDTFTPAEIPVFAEPDGRTTIGSIRVATSSTFPPEGGCAGLTVHVYSNGQSLGELPTREHEYEAPAAIVVGQRGQSFKVRLPNGAGWIRASKRDEFRSLQQLLKDGLAHVTDSAIGELRNAPGGAGTLLRERARDNQAVRIVRFRQLKDVLWIEVELLRESPCISPDDQKVVARGWMPAHAASGEPTIWFHSRGC